MDPQINFFGGIFWVTICEKGGPKRAILGHKKSLSFIFLEPLSHSEPLPIHIHNYNFHKKLHPDVDLKALLCVFSVFHCVEGHLMRHPGVTPKLKIRVLRDKLKNGRGRGWAASQDPHGASFRVFLNSRFWGT